jgi:hypothetical protein
MAEACEICGRVDGAHDLRFHGLYERVESLKDAVEALCMLAMTSEEDQKRVLRPIFETWSASVHPRSTE